MRILGCIREELVSRGKAKNKDKLKCDRTIRIVLGVHFTKTRFGTATCVPRNRNDLVGTALCALGNRNNLVPFINAQYLELSSL